MVIKGLTTLFSIAIIYAHVHGFLTVLVFLIKAELLFGYCRVTFVVVSKFVVLCFIRVFYDSGPNTETEDTRRTRTQFPSGRT